MAAQVEAGYQVLVVREACASATEELNRFSLEQMFPAFGGVASVDEVVAELTGPGRGAAHPA